MKESLIYPFDSEAFLEKWAVWLIYRKEIKKPILGTISKQAQLVRISRMSEGSEENAILLITQAIEKGWRGIYPLTNEYKPNANKRQSASDAHQRFWA